MKNVAVLAATIGDRREGVCVLEDAARGEL